MRHQSAADASQQLHFDAGTCAGSGLGSGLGLQQHHTSCSAAQMQSTVCTTAVDPVNHTDHRRCSACVTGMHVAARTEPAKHEDQSTCRCGRRACAKSSLDGSFMRRAVEVPSSSCGAETAAREGSITTNNVIGTAIRVTQGHSASAVDFSAVLWPDVPVSLAAALVAGGICKDQSQSLFIRHARTGVRRQRSRRRAASAERA